jgi:hypothetical protein
MRPLKLFKEIPLVIYFLFVVHVVFALSYTGNMTGDAINYYDMILGYASNLMHAGGYPYLMSRLLGRWGRFDWVARTFDHGPLFRVYLFILSQHIILVLSFIPLHRILKNVFSQRFASWVILAIGLQWGLMVMTSVFFPEWLQVSLFIGSFAWIWNAKQSPIYKTKIIYYIAGGFTFAFCYLTKYNALYFVSVFGLLLILDKVDWIKKAALLVGFVLSFMSVTTYYSRYPHKQTSGTTDLNYDHAWVLLYRTGMYLEDPELLKEAGINSKRLLLMNSLLPWDMAAANPIYEITQISKHAQEYRDKYEYILHADEAKIDELLQVTPRPKVWKWPYAFAPVSYHINWKDGDALGIAVFKECALHFPWLYFKSILSQTLRDITDNESFDYVPMEVSEQTHFYPLGKGVYEQRDPDLLLPGNPHRYYNKLGYFVFKPFADIFASWVELNRAVPYVLFTLLTALAGIISGLKLFKRERKSSEYFVFLTSILALGFVVFSNAVYTFRWDKEMMMEIPLVCICSVYSLQWLLQKLKEKAA